MKYLLLFLSMVPCLVYAGAYKCVVEGKTTYSQIPCGENAEVVIKDKPSEIKKPRSKFKSISDYSDEEIKNMSDAERQTLLYQGLIEMEYQYKKMKEAEDQAKQFDEKAKEVERSLQNSYRNR